MLEQYLTSKRGRKFQWGETDCFTLCIGWADTVNDSDLISQYQYSTAREAMAIVRDAGCKFSWELFDRHFDRVDFPEPGDIVAIERNSAEGIGVSGIKIATGVISVSERGVAFVDAPVIAAWRVG